MLPKYSLVLFLLPIGWQLESKSFAHLSLEAMSQVLTPGKLKA